MLLLGNCNDKLKEIKDNSIDLLLTDPPYGIEFMGKDWDKAVVHTETWKECYRVLKQGKLAFVMCSPRQDVLSRMIVNLQDAGFRTNYTSIYWTFASGFPKAANVSKLIDKANGRTQETFKGFAEHIKQKRLEKGLSMREIDDKLGTNTAYSWWEGRAAGVQLPSQRYYFQLKEILGLDDRYDELMEKAEAEREIISTQSKARSECDNFAMPTLGAKTKYIDINITKPATEEAKKMEGAYVGFQPKPAVEVILCVSKGKTLTWLDDCRIPFSDEKEINKMAHTVSEGSNYQTPSEGWDRPWRHDPEVLKQHREHKKEVVQTAIEKGRFPANLICQDDILNDGHNYKVGDLDKSTVNEQRNCYGVFKSRPRYTKGGDEGSYSRYFSLDQWWAKTFPLLSKALNTENNSPKPSKESIIANIVEKDSEIGRATEPNNSTSFAQEVTPHYSDSENLNQNAKSAERKQNSTGIGIAQKPVPIRLDMETLTETLSILENEFSTLITQSKNIPFNQNDVNSVIEKLNVYKDIIQICRNQLRSYGSVNPVTIEQTQQDLTQNLLTQNLPLEVRKTFPFLVCAKASKQEKNKGCEDLEGMVRFASEGESGKFLPTRDSGSHKIKGNAHPTVKPIKLMSYLITMGSREGDLILDPFCGSGTTLLAAHQLHRKYLGIELNPEYAQIIKKRMLEVQAQLKLSVFT